MPNLAVNNNPTDTNKQSSFDALNLPPELTANLESLGYAEMTAIQSQSLPLILAGEDVIAKAKTGSGKTAAFGLGLLAKIERKNFLVQVLVLCPTRELADQVANAIRELARTLPNIKVLTLCGGTPFEPQATSLSKGAHIVVGTPGRVDDHLRKATLYLDNVKTLVLDEADRMLEMGFQDELDAIVTASPDTRQTLLFSATFQDETQSVAERIMKAPKRVVAEEIHDSETIEQHFYETRDELSRLTAVRLLFLYFQPESMVVFCNTKKTCQEIAELLRSNRVSALALHGDLEQDDRDRTLLRFANKSVSVLVATDVAARGLDIDAIDIVVNYEPASDVEVHTHRIGRTGRAGSSGLACSFFAPDQRYKMNRLEKELGISISAEALPPYDLLDESPAKPKMVTLQIDGGKKQKLRPGDVLGALTAKDGIRGSQVGKINIFNNTTYVAVGRNAVERALKVLNEGKLKGRSCKARRVQGQPANSRRIARRRARQSLPAKL